MGIYKNKLRYQNNASKRLSDTLKKNIRFAAPRMRDSLNIFKLTQSQVGILNDDQSLRSDSLSRLNTDEIFFQHFEKGITSY